MLNETPTKCSNCNASLNTSESVIRAFYEENSNKKIFLKGHYMPERKDDLPAGTFCIDQDCVNIDSDIPEDNDECANCKKSISYD